MKTLDVKDFQRRKYARLPIVVLCDISKPETGEIVGRGCVLNYSKGGLAVITTARLEFLTAVNVSVDGLDQKGFLSARVVNSRPVIESLSSYGLEFQDMGALERVQIFRRFRRLFRVLVSLDSTAS